MNRDDSLFCDRAADLLDRHPGPYDLEERTWLDRHLEDCTECAADAAAAEKLAALVARSERAVDPGEKLWPGISARLDDLDASSAPPPTSATPWLKIAAAMLVGLGLGLVIAQRPQQPTSAEQRPQVSESPTIEQARFIGESGSFGSESVEEARLALRHAVEFRLEHISDSDREIVEHSLATIDAAITDLQSALERTSGPQHRSLQLMLASARRQELEFLQTAAHLPLAT